MEKQWYKIKEGVEYSTDFDFFLKHQILVTAIRYNYIFHSLLESKSFTQRKNVFGDGTISDAQIMEICKEIHKEIFEGKHGVGQFVN